MPTKKKKPAAKKKAAKKAAKKKAAPKKKAKAGKKAVKSAKMNIVRVAAKGAKAKAAGAKADKAEQLIAKGRERGYITYSEILKEFPTVEEDINFLDELYEKFTTAGIDILEGGMLEDNTDDYLASRNIKGRDSAAYDSI